MRGVSGEVQIKIIKGLSRMSKSNLFELIDLKERVNLAQIVDAQNMISSIIKELRGRGEII
ncbi:MAG: hypothetical protein FH761_08655 [Firmicutes bacterium]|nr:hypothetical protein [Bacillota bacterium]